MWYAVTTVRKLLSKLEANYDSHMIMRLSFFVHIFIAWWRLPHFWTCLKHDVWNMMFSRSRKCLHRWSVCLKRVGFNQSNLILWMRFGWNKWIFCIKLQLEMRCVGGRKLLIHCRNVLLKNLSESCPKYENILKFRLKINLFLLRDCKYLQMFLVLLSFGDLMNFWKIFQCVLWIYL